MKSTSELLDYDELKQSPILSMWKPSPTNRKKITVVIKHEHVLRSLSHDDVSRDELFYHTPCLTKYTNQYNNIDLTNDIWIKEPVLNTITITLYIKNTELAGPGTAFTDGDLKLCMLKCLVAIVLDGVLMYLHLKTSYATEMSIHGW